MGHRCVGFKAPAHEALVKSMRWAHTRSIIGNDSLGVDA
jgi:hypothetical protein